MLRFLLNLSITPLLAKEFNNELYAAFLTESEYLQIASIASLQVITDEMPLELRRQHLILKYFIEIESQFANPAFNSVIPPIDPLLISNKRMPETVSIHANRLIREMAIPMNNICPDFSYRILNKDKPLWFGIRIQPTFALVRVVRVD